jgi:hypothetical protein
VCQYYRVCTGGTSCARPSAASVHQFCRVCEPGGPVAPCHPPCLSVCQFCRVCEQGGPVAPGHPPCLSVSSAVSAHRGDQLRQAIRRVCLSVLPCLRTGGISCARPSMHLTCDGSRTDRPLHWVRSDCSLSPTAGSQMVSRCGSRLMCIPGGGRGIRGARRSWHCQENFVR